MNPEGPPSRGKAICTLIAIVKTASTAPDIRVSPEDIVDLGLEALIDLGVSTAELEAAAIFLSAQGKRKP